MHAHLYLGEGGRPVDLRDVGLIEVARPGEANGHAAHALVSMADAVRRAEIGDRAWTTVLAHLPEVRLSRVAYVCIGKRCLDVALAAIALVCTSWLMALLALLVRLDSPGPAIFRQTRIGRGGKPFTVYKFRTMRVDPSGELRLFRTEDGRYVHKIKDDPRVTRVGRFLRRTSLDELPQLWNVLRGEMSLVGPRPELPQIVRCYEPWQHARHIVRPGITGWWQISGRSHLPMHEHTEYDLYYVEHLSFWLDVKILLRTLWITVRGVGAF